MPRAAGGRQRAAELRPRRLKPALLLLGRAGPPPGFEPGPCASCYLNAGIERFIPICSPSLIRTGEAASRSRTTRPTLS